MCLSFSNRGVMNLLLAVQDLKANGFQSWGPGHLSYKCSAALLALEGTQGYFGVLLLVRSQPAHGSAEPFLLLVARGFQLLPVPGSFVLSAEPVPPTAHILWCHHLPSLCGHSPPGPEGGAAVQTWVSVLKRQGPECPLLHWKPLSELAFLTGRLEGLALRNPRHL